MFSYRIERLQCCKNDILYAVHASARWKKIEKNKSLCDESSALLGSVEHLMVFLDVINDNEKQQQKNTTKRQRRRRFSHFSSLFYAYCILWLRLVFFTLLFTFNIWSQFNSLLDLNSLTLALFLSRIQQPQNSY